MKKVFMILLAFVCVTIAQVYPEACGSGESMKVDSSITIKNSAVISASNGDAFFSYNAYYDGSWKRVIADNDVALIYLGGDGTIGLYQQSDANATANSVITLVERVLLTTSGNVNLNGDVNISGKLTVNGHIYTDYDIHTGPDRGIVLESSDQSIYEKITVGNDGVIDIPSSIDVNGIIDATGDIVSAGEINADGNINGGVIEGTRLSATDQGGGTRVVSPNGSTQKIIGIDNSGTIVTSSPY